MAATSSNGAIFGEGCQACESASHGGILVHEVLLELTFEVGKMHHLWFEDGSKGGCI